MTATCEATRRDGEPCQTQVIGDGRFCFAHSPDLAAKRAEAARRGGTNRANRVRLAKIMPLRLVPVWEQLEQALAAVLDGSLDPKQASAAAAVARALVAVQQAGEVEERLRKLEEGSA
jgi:hypothetical protein